MPSMRATAVILLTVTLLFGLVPARRVLPAQLTGQATCDATLVTLLLVGIRDYGYQAPIRLDYYNFAQYRFLVAAATGGDLPESLAANGTAGDPITDLIERAALQIDDSALPSSAVKTDAVQTRSAADRLTSGVLPGEAEICSLLRADLVNFLYDHLHTDLYHP